jgi:putative transcriptional regulator
MSNAELELGSFQRDERTDMSKTSTPTVDGRDQQGMTLDDWQRLDAMTDEEITAAALADPDNPPLTKEQLAQFRRSRPLCKIVRNRLGLTREAFATAYGIPLETLVAWERHEAEPTPAEMSYLHLIEREPERAKRVEVD